jgi:hypothetical protein
MPSGGHGVKLKGHSWEACTVNNLFFWIIILSILIPMGLRMYRRSISARDQNQGFPGRYPGQFPGQYPGRQSNQPRDGYTQQDYMNGGFMGGGFGQTGRHQPLPPPGQPYQDNDPYRQPDPFQGPYPGHHGPGGYGASSGYRDPFHPQGPGPHPAPPQGPGQYQEPGNYQGHGHPSGPQTPPSPSAPMGYRARKLAELDEKYSNGEISTEEYVSRRAEIMKG